MKRKNLKLFILLMFVSIATANAQLDNVKSFINGGKTDANILATAYMNPWGSGFATSLANGWYNTATTHSFLPIPGFDITISGTYLSIPSADQSFDVSKLNLTTLVDAPNASKSTSISAPTIAGKNSSGPPMYFKNTNVKALDMPSGTGLSAVFLPILQAGIGLPFSFELDARFAMLPKISNTPQLYLWGVGLKHDIKQWIPVISHVPFWAMSLQAGYTSFNASASDVAMTASAFTGNLLLSTDIPIINLYGGIGFTSATSNLKVTGNYTLPDKSVIADPIDITMKGKSGLHTNIGLRLKLAVLTLHGDVTYASGSTFYTGGIGISFR